MKTNICIPDAPKPGHTIDKVKALTDLEVLQAIAKFRLELNWDEDEEDDEDSAEAVECPTKNRVQLSVFPTATGGSWFYGNVISTPEHLETDKVELIRTVVSRVAYCAQVSGGASITDIFVNVEEDEDDL